MRRNLICAKVALLAGSTLAGLCAGAAGAQEITVAPVRQSLDENGVDLFTGTFNTRTPGLSIGQGERTLTYSLAWYGGGWAASHPGITRNGNTVTVGLGDRSEGFRVSGSSFVSTEGNGSTLTLSGSTYTFRGVDGTIVYFDRVSKPQLGYDAVGTQIVRPSGERLLIEWTKDRRCVERVRGEPDMCQRSEPVARLAGFRNDANVSIRMIYESDASPSESPFNTASWSRLVRTEAVNPARSASPTQSISVGHEYTASEAYLFVTDPTSRVTRYRQTGSRITGVMFPGSQVEDITLSYSADNRVSRYVTPAGATAYASSDSGNTRTVSVTKADGRTTTYVFNIALARMVASTDPLGRRTEWEYDDAGRTIATIRPDRDLTRLFYDPRGNVVETRIVGKPGSAIGDIVTSATFEAGCGNPATCNQPVATTDAKGGVTNYTYAAHGGITSITSPPGADGVRPQVVFGYASFASPASGQTVNELSTVSTCRTAQPGGCHGSADETRTTIAYETANLFPVSRTTSAGDGSTTSTTSIGYDAAGNVISEDGPLPGASDTTRRFYDAARRPTLIVGSDPDGGGARRAAALQVGYDAAGRVLSRTTGYASADGSGFTGVEETRPEYDAAGRVRRVTVLSGDSPFQLTDYSYDAAGRLECTAQRMNPGIWGSLPGSACIGGSPGSFGLDRIVRNAYREDGRLRSVTTGYGAAGASTETIDYTANGQVASMADGNGNVTSYGYDRFDRLQTTIYPGGSYEQLGYDENGNVTSRRLRDGQTLYYQYDALNRRTYADNPNTGVAEVDASYSYDNLGRITRASDQNGWFAAFEYDALGRVTRQYSNLSSNGMQYDAGGRMIRQTWGDGFFVTYEYDQAGAVTAIRENGGFVLASFGYDDLGRRTSISRGNGTTTTYGYSGASRLTGLGQDLAGTAHDLSLGFGYNPAGQIASRTSSNAAFTFGGGYDVARVYSVNGLNQYVGAGATNFEYDARGNLIRSGETAYGYNSRNEMTSGPGVQLAYRNPAGLLNHLIRSDGSVTNFDYVGADMVNEIENGAVARRYVFGPGTDEPLVLYEGSGTGDRRWLHTDERGSVIAMTNGAGAATAINTYDDHGIPGPDNQGRFQYTGQKWIAELGMYDYKARMYSPTLGRFMQTDPIGYADGMNWYNYVGGDPVNKTDPSGLSQQIVRVCTRVGGGSYTVGNTVVVSGGQEICGNTIYNLPDSTGQGLPQYGSMLAPPGAPSPSPSAAPAPQNEQPPICTRGQVVAQAIGNRAMQVGREATKLGDKAALGGTLAAAGSAALLNPAGVLVSGLVADAGVMVSVAGRLQIAGGAALSVLGGRSIRSTGSQVITDWLPFSDYYKDKADRAVNAALDFVGVPDRPRCRKQ